MIIEEWSLGPESNFQLRISDLKIRNDLLCEEWANAKRV
jgi:hypothetical protein